MRRRRDSECRTIDAMIALFCREQHGADGVLCEECGGLKAYARQRLDKCPFKEDKPTCAKCPIHCYKPDYRERMRAVMRYAGPRMVWRRPLLAIRHLLNEHKAAPEDPRRLRKPPCLEHTTIVPVAPRTNSASPRRL